MLRINFIADYPSHKRSGGVSNNLLQVVRDSAAALYMGTILQECKDKKLWYILITVDYDLMLEEKRCACPVRINSVCSAVWCSGFMKCTSDTVVVPNTYFLAAAVSIIWANILSKWHFLGWNTNIFLLFVNLQGRFQNLTDGAKTLAGGVLVLRCPSSRSSWWTHSTSFVWSVQRTHCYPEWTTALKWWVSDGRLKPEMYFTKKTTIKKCQTDLLELHLWT